MPLRRVRVNLRRLLRRVLHQDDPPQRVARGVAAGFFAAAFPLPGFQIPLSLFCAFLARGNAAVAILPQFLSNAGTMFPLALLQFKIGTWLWPAAGADADRALASLRQAAANWVWAQPLRSCAGFFEALGGLGLDVLAALFLGVLITGLAAAVVSYPPTVIGVWVWRARRRRLRLARAPAPRLRPFELAAPEAAPTPEAQVIAWYAQSPHDFLRAATVKLLVDGREAFPEMLGAIAAARRTIEMESYILRPDRTGRRFGEALTAAARRGVRVRLMYDAVGSLGLPSSYLQQLTSAGAAVSVYHPLILTRPTWAINRRNHRKLMVVDDAVAFTGGLNIADDYAPREDGGAGWRDTHVRLDGAQPARELRALFEDTWERAKPCPGSPEFSTRAVEAQAPAPGVPDGVAAQVLGNAEFLNRRRIRRAHLYAINHARQYILIENAYFIPDRGVRRALARAVRRGVKVAVAMAATGSSDVAIAAHASRALYSELLAAGVRLFEWPHGMLHAKTAVIDDAWAVVGSYNFDHRSLSHDLEVVVVVAEAQFARRLREQTLADLARCHEVTLAEHETRPWSRMLIESAAYQMRYWL